MTGNIYPPAQDANRAKLFSAHQLTLDSYWDKDGHFAWATDLSAHGGYRVHLFHCLAYLAGDDRCVARANRIIVTNFAQTPCHFAPGAALDILTTYRDRLEPDALACLERLIELNVPYMSTEDLKVHGYNDNHVHKAIYSLIIGGEYLGTPQTVERGMLKLRQAVEMFERNGFPCEYNSPNYAPVSLIPLASLAEHTKSDEVRELALRLERFYWRDVALHFDSRVGLPAGPMTRCGDSDATGMTSGTMSLLAYLYPERFAFDYVGEAYGRALESPIVAQSNKLCLPFYHGCVAWMAHPNYHVTPELEEAIFAKPVGTTVRGTAESGTSAVAWKTPADRPEGAPLTHHLGPRRSLLTTYYGEGFSLGTSQYSWLDGVQAHSFYATISHGQKRSPQDAAVYYTRLFFDEENPYGERPVVTGCFKDYGEIRTIQHEGSAMVFYNPHPIKKSVQKIRTGLFRPMMYHAPRELWVGETRLPQLNGMFEQFAPIAIDEGDVYVGIIPTSTAPPLMSARKAALQVHTYSSHLVIGMTGYENWSPTDLSYEQIIETNMGFVFEIHAASGFASFAAFRAWLAKGTISDDYYGNMRTTTYRTDKVELSTCYSPFTSMFRHASINRKAVEVPVSQVDGMPDPGFGIAIVD
ncbi:MAG TPA: hypothetical protein VGK19_24405 [Capsulimonadaceae bacterium]